MAVERPAGSPFVLTDDRGAVRVLTLNDPDRRNAISLELRVELIRELDAAMADPAVRAIVLTGAGGTFSSGGDLSTLQVDDPAATRERMNLLARVISTIVNGGTPVVAAVEGTAFGAGLSLAASCDYIVASDDARFCASFGRVGLMPDGCLLWTLPPRVGLGRARAIMLTSDVISAPDAAGWGLAEELATPGTTLTVAVERATALAAGPSRAFAATKRILAAGATSLEELAALEIEAQVALLASRDFAEGRDAFFAKRKAVFTGE